MVMASPVEGEVVLPARVRSSQFPTVSGALMTTNGGSGSDGGSTATHWAGDVSNAPICGGKEHTRRFSARGKKRCVQLEKRENGASSRVPVLRRPHAAVSRMVSFLRTYK